MGGTSGAVGEGLPVGGWASAEGEGLLLKGGGVMDGRGRDFRGEGRDFRSGVRWFWMASGSHLDYVWQPSCLSALTPWRPS